MARLGDLGCRARSKNAGPFAVTIDIFCSDEDGFDRIREAISGKVIEDLYRLPAGSVTRFEMDRIRVLKFSFRRPTVQGGRLDRDMHAAQLAVLLEELDIAGLDR